jgi:hypothetical protein
MAVEMSLSRKRRKELKRLRSSAEDLWGNQQDVLDHASKIAREASRQVNLLAQEEVVPRVRTGYQAYVRPGVDQARTYARNAGDQVERGLGTALGSLLSIGDIANDARVRRSCSSKLTVHSESGFSKSKEFGSLESVRSIAPRVVVVSRTTSVNLSSSLQASVRKHSPRS